jgi:hypothetical protein
MICISTQQEQLTTASDMADLEHNHGAVSDANLVALVCAIATATGVDNPVPTS